MPAVVSTMIAGLIAGTVPARIAIFAGWLYVFLFIVAEGRQQLCVWLWDAVGTEFGGRHGLYETNYTGNHEDIRVQALWHARGSGALDRMVAPADQCLADCDESGWRDLEWLNPGAVAYSG